MTSERPRRVAEQIQRFLSSRLVSGLRDPRLGFTTLTSVEVSRDLKSARVYITVFEQDPAKKKEALKALAGMAGMLRREMGRELRLRYTPELHFQEDISVERADRIEHLIQDIHAGEARSDDDESE